MRYHNITTDDMKNGSGLRVVLWLSGCEHHCKGCQNTLTWNSNDGLEFDVVAKEEIFNELKKDHISGITFSGGDPLYITNRGTVFMFCQEIKNDARFKNKTIWLYTGYTWDQVLENNLMRAIMDYVDVLVDGKFVEELLDVNYPWAGSTNQRVINVKESLEKGTVVLYENH